VVVRLIKLDLMALNSGLVLFPYVCLSSELTFYNDENKTATKSEMWKRNLEAAAVEAVKFLWKRKHFEERSLKRKRTRKHLTF